MNFGEHYTAVLYNFPVTNNKVDAQTSNVEAALMPHALVLE
jgi:hypothetical protein